MSKGKNIAYVRVSTVEQNEARQREALGKYNIDKWFIEKASGKTMKRPKLQEMLGSFVKNDVDICGRISDSAGLHMIS